MNFLKSLFILGVILILLGLISFNTEPTTGSMILTKDVKITDLLIVFSFCLITISGIGEIDAVRREIDTIRRKLEGQYKREFPYVEVRFSKNIYGAKSIHPQKLPSRMSQEKKEEIYRRWDDALRSGGLKDYEIPGLDRSKITVFMPPYYGKKPTIFYAALYEALGHDFAYAHNVENKVSNEGIAQAYRFKGLLEMAKEGKFPLEKAIDQIEDDIKNETKGPFSGLMHYREALEIVRLYNPSLKFRDRNPDEVITELDKSINYILSPSERLKFDLRRLAEKLKSVFSKK